MKLGFKKGCNTYENKTEKKKIIWEPVVCKEACHMIIVQGVVGREGIFIKLFHLISCKVEIPLVS